MHMITNEERKNPTKNMDGRWLYLDLCRVISIFCVVLIHAAATLVYGEPVGSFGWTVNSIFFGATRFCLPIFFMVSGALFLNPQREVPLKKLYKNNILRLVTSMLFWSAMYYIFLVYMQGGEYSWQNFRFDIFLKQVLTGHPDHHWFLFSMIALYIVVPVLRSITKNKKGCQYYLIVWFAFQIVLYTAKLGLRFLPDMDSGIQSVLEAFVNFFNNIAPNAIMGFSGYMVLGYYLHAYPPKAKTRHILQVLGVLGMVFTVVVTYFVSVSEGATTEAFYDAYPLWILAAAVAAFLTTRSIFPNVTTTEDKPSRSRRTLLSLSTCSFGIYLVHDFFLNYANRNGYAFELPSVISALVIALGVYALSYITIFIIKKIPILRDYIC